MKSFDCVGCIVRFGVLETSLPKGVDENRQNMTKLQVNQQAYFIIVPYKNSCPSELTISSKPRTDGAIDGVSACGVLCSPGFDSVTLE